MIVFIIPSFLEWFVRAEKCTLCMDGSPIPSPQNFVYDPDSGYNETCEYHNDFVGLVFPPESAYCKYAQIGGLFLCDCEILEDRCRLCHDGSPIVNETHELDILTSEFNSGKAGTPLDKNLTCDWLGSSLAVYIEAGTTRCWEYQQRFSSECGCKSPPLVLESNSTYNNNETMVMVVEEPSSFNSTCKVCGSKDQMLYPEREFEFDIYKYYVDDSINGFSIKNCSELDFWVSVLPGIQSEMCGVVEMMSSYCGCQDAKKLDSTCTLCPNGSPPRYPLKTLNWNDKDIYNHMSFHLPVKRFNCGMFDSIMRNFNEDEMGISEGQYCLFAHLRSNYCGCDIDWKPIVIIFCFRISGILSLLGSSFVIFCVFHKKKLKSTYHQLLLGLSIFDVVGSIMYILCTTMTPVEDGMFEAMGNLTTCKMQGFFFQLGLTSAFFNALLSLYFYLMICKNWGERKFQRYRMYTYILVIVVGLLLAFTGLQYYYTDMLYLYCYIRPPPAEESYLPIMLWNVAPIAFVFIFMSVNTALLVYAVYKQHKASNKWNFTGSVYSPTMSSGRNLRKMTNRTASICSSTQSAAAGRGLIRNPNSLSQRSLSHIKGKKSVFHRVLWQSIYYLLSYTLTLPILMLRSLVHLTSNEYMKTSDALFMWNVIIAIFCPAQGIFNAIIFYNRENASKKSGKKNSCNLCKSLLGIFSSCKKDVQTSHEKGKIKGNKTVRLGETAQTFLETKSNISDLRSSEMKSTTQNSHKHDGNTRNDDDLENVVSEESECGHEAALEFLELTKGDGEIKLFSKRLKADEETRSENNMKLNENPRCDDELVNVAEDEFDDERKCRQEVVLAFLPDAVML